MPTTTTTTKRYEARLDELEEEIAEVREEQERNAEISDQFHFATPEAYQAEQLANSGDVGEQPDRDANEPPTQFGNVGQDLLKDDEDDESETERAAQRAIRERE